MHLLDSKQPHVDPKHNYHQRDVCVLSLFADTLFTLWHVHVFLFQKYMYIVLE